ncbi:MAG: PHP domain-containing protein, partial [Bowdeniella nasicola]|nr:PHP domain-containing protein [Bowdeniella nasicola]
MRIDLHAHSAISDGTDTPTELMFAAAKAGLDVVALTDHDTIAGWDEAAAAVGSANVALVRGIEISCSADGITAHLLGYLHNPARGDDLDALLSQARAARIRRIEEMTARIAKDYPISIADVYRQAGTSRTIGRPHLADALVAAGVIANRSAAFEQLLATSSPYYVRYQAPHPVEVTELVRAAGGVPIFAHPRATKRQRRFVSKNVIRDMVKAGLFA